MIRISEIFYTLSEAASELGVGRHTIWRRIKAGNLESQKVGGVVFIERKLIGEMKTQQFNRQGG